MFSIELVDSTSQHQSLYIEDIHEILINKMNLEHDDIEGVQSQGPSSKSFEVMISSMTVWNNKNISDALGKKINLSLRRVVIIDRPYEDLTHVIVKRIPMFWGPDKLQKIFNWYGNVKKIKKGSIAK